MKRKILLNQKVNKGNVQYEWVAENGACETCQSMDGKIYDSANDIPDRPHPNCLELQTFTQTQRFRSHGAVPFGQPRLSSLQVSHRNHRKRIG